MKKLNKETGFTLAELLIVVAIIAILVAIGIPAFSTAMERSRETVDLSNIRGAYAEFMAETLSGTHNTGAFKIDFKQRDFSSGTKGWTIDTSGFAVNVQGSEMPNMPSGIKTGYNLVKFTFKNATGEKPIMSIETDTSSVTSGDILYTTVS